jgi:hypothetical protein
LGEQVQKFQAVRVCESRRNARHSAVDIVFETPLSSSLSPHYHIQVLS